jgi:small nuclear ribonucleoprotein G
MPKDKGPELKKFMGKRLLVKLNGNRGVIGRLSGFDVFMNLTLEDAEEVISDSQSRPVGMIVIRGSSVIEMGVLDQA